jgi:hypothetical protein
MKDIIREILLEETKKWEYQVRYIDGPVFYKRREGENTWCFVGAEEFVKNAHKSKIIKWGEKSN